MGLLTFANRSNRLVVSLRVEAQEHVLSDARVVVAIATVVKLDVREVERSCTHATGRHARLVT